MHFSGWEKFGFGLLVTAWLVWGSIMMGNFLVHADESKVAALRLAPAEGEAAGGGAAPAADSGPVDIVALLHDAKPEDGAKVFKKCQTCHSAEKGAKNKVGPELWDVMGRGRAALPDFAYSDALKKKGGEWTFDDLNHFLTKPSDFAPGTKMTFVGLKDPKERAAVIDYLRTQSDSPKPLP
jgi:cytochrome c